MLEMLKHDFLRHALAAAMIAGASLSFVGVYVILRRIVFVGAALAQLGAAGVGLALLTGQSPLLGGTSGSFRWGFRFHLDASARAGSFAGKFARCNLRSRFRFGFAFRSIKPCG